MRAACLLAVALATLMSPAVAAQEGVLIVDISNFAAEHRARGAADARADMASGHLAVYGALGALMTDTDRESDYKARHNSTRTEVLSQWGLRSRQEFNACVPIDAGKEAYREGYTQASEPFLKKLIGNDYEKRISAEIERRLAAQIEKPASRAKKRAK